MDLTSYTDEELNALQIDIINEKDRRSIIASVPDQIQYLSAQYFIATNNGQPPVEAAERGVANPNFNPGSSGPTT